MPASNYFAASDVLRTVIEKLLYLGVIPHNLFVGPSQELLPPLAQLRPDRLLYPRVGELRCPAGSWQEASQYEILRLLASRVITGITGPYCPGLSFSTMSRVVGSVSRKADSGVNPRSPPLPEVSGSSE